MTARQPFMTRSAYLRGTGRKWAHCFWLSNKRHTFKAVTWALRGYMGSWGRP